jgi:hypothetical protein
MPARRRPGAPPAAGNSSFDCTTSTRPHSPLTTRSPLPRTWTGGSRRRLPTSRGGYLLGMAHHSAQRHRLNSPLRNTALLVLLTAVAMPIMLALAASGTYGAMTLILGG